jgi:hypothetical protein
MKGLAARARPTALGIALAAALLLVAFGLGAPRAECDGCLPTFCGHSAECSGDCVCAIPMGEATGTCMGTR